MLIEQYPVGWAVDTSKGERVLVYLIDIPGIAMQGRTWSEAVGKLQAFAPRALATYRAEGLLPPPSNEPSLEIGSLQVTGPPSRDVRAAPEIGERVELATA